MSIAVTPADQRLRQGGILFLVALNVFFVAGMILYLLLVTWRREEAPDQLLPASFLKSTIALLFASGALIVAHRAVRREKRSILLVSLAVACIAGCEFLGLQAVAMKVLIEQGMQVHGTRGLWGIVVTLAVLHALHVAGGIIGLAVIAYGALRDRYDHERHWPVEFVGIYWHFLDIVWICMLGTFWLTSGGFV